MGRSDKVGNYVEKCMVVRNMESDRGIWQVVVNDMTLDKSWALVRITTFIGKDRCSAKPGEKSKYNNWQGNLASGSDKVRPMKS